MRLKRREQCLQEKETFVQHFVSDSTIKVCLDKENFSSDSRGCVTSLFEKQDQIASLSSFHPTGPLTLSVKKFGKVIGEENEREATTPAGMQEKEKYSRPQSLELLLLLSIVLADYYFSCMKTLWSGMSITHRNERE